MSVSKWLQREAQLIGMAAAVALVLYASPTRASGGLISHWNADGSTADIAGTNTGVAYGGATFAPGIEGQAFSFDGVNDAVNVLDAPSLRLVKSVTIAAWVNVASYPNNVPGIAQIVFRGDLRGGLDPFALTLWSNGRIGIVINSLTGGEYVDAPIPRQRWVHVIACLDDASGSLELYLDGKLVAQKTTSERPFAALDPAMHPGLGIGNVFQYPGNPHQQPFHGLIDEVKLYDVPIRPPGFPPSHLVFTTQPDLAEAGKPFQQQPVVLARDANNVLIADYNGPVTLAIQAGTGTPGGALTGTATVIAVNGVATFTDLGVDRKGTGYVLEAFVGPNKLGESAAFNVSPKAERLVFTAQPGGATDDWPFTSQPIVSVVDADGETASLNRGVITLAIKPGTGFPGATLNGTATLNAIAGVASFTDVRIGVAAPGYVLTVNGQSLTGAESAAFDVTPFLFSMADVRDNLRWAAGLGTLPPGYLDRYDVVLNGRVDLSDATRILRKVAGLEANP